MKTCPYIIRVSILWYNQLEQLIGGLVETYEAEQRMGESACRSKEPLPHA